MSNSDPHPISTSCAPRIGVLPINYGVAGRHGLRSGERRLKDTENDSSAWPGGLISSRRKDEGTTMKAVKVAIAASALTAAATVIAPPAHAAMQLGNYDVLTNRYDRASWVWFISACIPEKSADCIDVSGIARLKYYYEYGGRAPVERHLLVHRRCARRRAMPRVQPAQSRHLHMGRGHLAGTIDSQYDVGCFNGPPGSQLSTFALQRL
jgi:hypothetical protein